jgi:hypothetical protein
MKPKPKSKKPEVSNIFTVEADLHLGYNSKESTQLNRWLCVQHDGREQIPMNEKVPQALQDAAWHIYASHRFTLEFEMNKQGHWKFRRVL